MDDELTETERATLRQTAIENCTHPDQWISKTEVGYTADACWDCLIDAYFLLRTP